MDRLCKWFVEWIQLEKWPHNTNGQYVNDRQEWYCQLSGNLISLLSSFLKYVKESIYNNSLFVFPLDGSASACCHQSKVNSWFGSSYFLLSHSAAAVMV